MLSRHYLKSNQNYIRLGFGAIIKPIDHPNHLVGHAVSNKNFVHTSRVITIQRDGKGFETMNTIYKQQGE